MFLRDPDRDSGASPNIVPDQLLPQDRVYRADVRNLKLEIIGPAHYQNLLQESGHIFDLDLFTNFSNQNLAKSLTEKSNKEQAKNYSFFIFGRGRLDDMKSIEHTLSNVLVLQNGLRYARITELIQPNKLIDLYRLSQNRNISLDSLNDISEAVQPDPLSKQQNTSNSSFIQ